MKNEPVPAFITRSRLVDSKTRPGGGGKKGRGVFQWSVRETAREGGNFVRALQ